jgi:PKD repeat protein
VDVTLVVTACVPVNNASIAFAPASPVVGAPTTFTGTVDDTSSTPIQFVWDFGDGSAPMSSGYQWNTSHVVAHTYALSDTYTVVMTATNSCGQIVAVRSVVVAGEPVISVTPLSLSAVLNPGQTAGQTTPREISISNASTATADLNWGLAEVPPVTWLGEAPAGGVITPSGSSNVVVTFNSVGLAVGTYTDTLQVSSNDLDDPVVNVGVTLVVTTVCVPISGADFDFAPNRPITAGDTVVFTGSVTQGTLPLVYTWDFGDGTPEQQRFENTTTGGTTISHLYTSDKEGYTVRMTVSNCGGEVVVSKQIGKAYIYLPLVMRNFTPPEPTSIDSLDSDSPVMLGEPMHFTATVSGDEPITYTWDLDDDGTPEQSSVGLDTISYTYTITGDLTATLDVENAYGGDSTSVGVTVNPAFAAASITALESDSPVALGEPMHFTATVAGTAPITYSWDFDGDGTPEQSDVGLATTTYIYPTSGFKVAILEVENAWGNDNDQVVVQVTTGRASLFGPLYGAIPASEAIVSVEAFDDPYS